MLFEKCRRRIPPVSILYLQTVSISFFPSLTLTLFLLHVAFFSLTFTHRFASFTHFTVHFSFFFSRFFVSLFSAYGLKDFYDFQYHLLVSDHFCSLIHILVVLYTTIPGRLPVGYVARYIAKYFSGCARVKCHRSKIPVCGRAKVSREYRIRDTGQPR